MFPYSEIAKKFACGKDKTGYIVRFGLAPYFKEQLVNSINKAGPFVLMFGLNQATKKKQMDVHIRSVYLFKGDSYWKFLFPGSPVQDGYPRSSSADWLDCPDPSSSSPVLDDLSLSLSPPAGRQELRERWKGETGKEEGGEPIRGTGRTEVYPS
ncbi:hypothetical protein KUCAC02_016580 [Chaenocephalus aceratus]|nr:hypothetical protein KUCAC02_016580 [Chaenocephalus aceratus]